MPIPSAVVIELTDEERALLESWTRPHTSAQALALRARIVLAAAGSLTNGEIASSLGVSRPTVTKWRNRFAEQRVDGLLDEPRPGRPRTITDEQVERVVITTLESKPKDATHWSTRSMARETGMTADAVMRIWHAFGLQPHRQETWHLVLDNASSHKTPQVRRWFAAHPRFHLHLTPTSSSWINLVERWFSELTTKLLRRGAHRSVRALNADIRQWIDTWNENPRPYVWTKTADQILDSIKRYCQRINQTGH
jgi:transposase